MTSLNLDEVTAALANTQLVQEGVSFQGRSLKLDTAEDAKEVIDAINNSTKLEYLNLEGNTLGVEAAKAIAKALEKHPELKRALWKDMFTGRMKTEIPIALKHLGDGLVTAGVKLTELDLSDNAFGPIGVEGLAALLRSSSCYNLQELRLNNNGLGITGGKLLAKALMDCYNSSKNNGMPLALKVFVAGRNRLENEGARALAEVFSTIGSLEEIVMPQNGIYHVGITALSDAFTKNKNLRILNLNDNTIGLKGSRAIAKVLPSLQNLQEINFGDCLLKTKGAVELADALKSEHRNLRDLTLDSNEIGPAGGLAIAGAMNNKDKLSSLILGCNQFGSQGCKDIQLEMKKVNKLDTLGTLSEDESGESEEEDEEQQSEESEKDSDDEENENTSQNIVEKVTEIKSKDVTVLDFLNCPTEENFSALGEERCRTILDEVKKLSDNNSESYLNKLVPILMKVSALSNSKDLTVSQSAMNCTESLFEELFRWANQSEQLSLVNNSLMVNLGLLKSEDKKFKPMWDTDGCLHALNLVLQKNYFPVSTRDTLKMFMGRQVFDVDANLLEKSFTNIVIDTKN